MKSESTISTEASVAEADSKSQELQTQWKRVVRRRSFLRGLGLASVALPASVMLPGSALLAAEERGGAGTSLGKLNKGDIAILRFLAAAEIIESDLWVQYAELGGARGGNPSYIAALSNLDGDMPQYISDNTDDELSHAAFLNAYLRSKGAHSVNLDRFRTLPSSHATGAKQIGRLTNLMNLNVDLSWYTRYRSEENPDLGANPKGPFSIINEPAIPLNDTETPPNTPQPIPPTSNAARRMQAIANTAGFHFAFIEQGGSSLYTHMALNASDLEVLKIIVSIGGVEVDHFGLWHDKAGNAVSQPLAGVVDPHTGLHFPDLNNHKTPLTQTNLVLPEPCDFISEGLPSCSVIRPTSKHNAGAVAAVHAFTTDQLFEGQSHEFLDLIMSMAIAADEATRQL